MKKALMITLFLCSPSLASAQTKTLVDLRLGMRDQATYRYAEVFQVRDRWIFPDVGYVDFGSSDYRELFAGAGRKLFVSKPLTIIEVLYFEQAIGPEGNGARWLLPWTLAAYEFHPRLRGEAVYFPYLPINQAGRIQHVVDHATLLYSFSPVFKAGVGYGAYQFGDDAWQNKLFAIATVTPKEAKFGSFEFWLEMLPDDKLQVQFRYKISRTTKHRSQ